MLESDPALIRQEDSSAKKSLLPPFARMGLEAFEAGLDEISKYHSVVPDSIKFDELVHRGYEEKYVSIALQLSNNRTSEAERLVLEMRKRAQALIGTSSPHNSDQDNNNSVLWLESTLIAEFSPVPDSSDTGDENWEVVEVGCLVCKRHDELEDQLISCSTCQGQYHTVCVGARRIPFGMTTEKDLENRARYVRRHYGSWTCLRCKKKQQQQLVSQSQGEVLQQGGEISLSQGSAATITAVADMDKQQLQCRTGVTGGGVVATDRLRPLINETVNSPVKSPVFSLGTPSKAASQLSISSTPMMSSMHHPPSPFIRSKHDQMALLVGLLSSSKIGLEDLLKMHPEKQKDVLIEIIQKKYPGYSVEASAELQGHLDLAQAMRGIIAQSSADSTVSAVSSIAPKSPVPASGSAERYFGAQFAEEQQKQKAKEKENENVSFDPRAHMMSIIMKRGEAAAAEKSEKSAFRLAEGMQTPYNAFNSTAHNDGSNNFGIKKTSLSTLYSNQIGFSAVGGFVLPQNPIQQQANSLNNHPTGPAITLSLSSGVSSTKVKDIPQYSKYFKMLKAGIDKELVSEKMLADGVIGSKETAKQLFQSNPDEPIPAELYDQLNVLVSISNHPQYEKFFKMLNIGLQKDQIKAHMTGEGLDPNIIDKDPVEKIRLVSSALNNVASKTSPEENSGNSEGQVALDEHPHYQKFFKMLKIGMPIETIQKKMQQEGFDASILDRNPQERVDVPSGNEVQKIAIGEHPIYSKYFRMLKVGLPKDAVKEKMNEEGLNSEMIDKDAMDLVVLDEVNPSTPSKIPVSMHPKYAKYFKMVTVGLPKEAIKEKMRQEGVNPDVLEKEPDDMVSPNDDKDFQDTAPGGKKTVPLSEHPLYAKYFKMLKVGLSKDAIKAKMMQENVDPDIIDNEPTKTVSLEDENAKNKQVPIAEHPKYAKYYKMLKVGLPKDAVKAKMTQEGVNPDMLDKEPTEMIPLEEEVKKEENEEEKVPVAEHPKYAKYFKMLKVGLPKDAVKAKMTQEGVNPDVLDKEPTELIPVNESKPEAAKEQVPVAEHPKYSKYFKMLKVGLPKPAVKAKMTQEGVNPDMLDKEPTDLIPLDEDGDTKKPKKDVPMVPVAEHPKYSKYFKMLKVGLPKPAVKAKMTQEGVNPDMLDKEPTDLIPADDEAEEDEGPKVPAGEHPSYAKFFKMMKVGLPKDAVKAKVKQEGLNPDILDKEPTDLILLNEKAAGSAAGGLAKAKPKPKRKKLHWKAFDASKVDKNSLWAEEQEIDLELDEEEFKKLFVESAVEEDAKVKKKLAVSKPAKEVRKQVVLIDMKRAQNGGIALARIKFAFDELKEKIFHMSDEGLTTDQLKSMQEYLPNSEELGALRNFTGEKDSLGNAERYMLVMLSFPAASRHITIMIYKQLFKARYIECRGKILKLQDACDDVRLSARLKKVLKTILKVGNQLNEGEENKGFTVDSLLKLHSAKALDKKTTILQYVVMLIFRNDEDSLKFPEDLKHVVDASRITMETIIAEKNGLQTEFEANFKMLEEIREKNPDSNTNSMLDFFVKADSHCKELERGYEKAKEKFAGVLTYFGEDPNMPPHEFFTTLSKFIQDFVGVRETIDKARKAEQKKREQLEASISQQQQQQTLPHQPSSHKILDKETTPQQRRAMRRHTMVPTQKPNTPTPGSHPNSGEGGGEGESVFTFQQIESPKKLSGTQSPAKHTQREGKDAAETASAPPTAPSDITSPVAQSLAASAASTASAAVTPSLPPSQPPQEETRSVPAPSSPAGPALQLNFADPNDRAALLKEALAKKALSRRKSSIM
jgi:hypothetical protein